MITEAVKQGSAEWADLRLGIPTASQYHRIITPKTMKLSAGSEGYRNQLLAEWALGYPVVDAESGFMDRGNNLEDDARSFYEVQREVDLIDAGFILTDDRRTGGSPDALVGDDGGAEIKCLSAPNHIGFLLHGLDDTYRPQVQGYLWITGRKWWDVVLYSPSFPSAIVRIERDDDFIAKFVPALTQFCEQLDQDKRELLRRGVVQRTVFGRKTAEAPPERGLFLVGKT